MDWQGSASLARQHWVEEDGARTDQAGRRRRRPSSARTDQEDSLARFNGAQVSLRHPPRPPRPLRLRPQPNPSSLPLHQPQTRSPSFDLPVDIKPPLRSAKSRPNLLHLSAQQLLDIDLPHRSESYLPSTVSRRRIRTAENSSNLSEFERQASSSRRNRRLKNPAPPRRQSSLRSLDPLE